MSNYVCEKSHPHGPRCAWLCITSKFDQTIHAHVCGIHAKMFSREHYIFYALDGDNSDYEWLSGIGCRVGVLP